MALGTIRERKDDSGSAGFIGIQKTNSRMNVECRLPPGQPSFRKSVQPAKLKKERLELLLPRRTSRSVEGGPFPMAGKISTAKLASSRETSFG